MSRGVVIRDITKKYGDVTAVNKINLSIKEGEFFTIVGPSGCGKTTLLRMIAGFNEIDGGEILFDDKVINEVPAHLRNIGMVFQQYALFPHMSIFKNVAYGLKARKFKAEEINTRVDEVLNMMQIKQYEDRDPSKLSGGQQQRVALARALVIHPVILLMDEPLSNLDAKLRIQMRIVIKKIQKELNITTIYVTHDQEEALSMSDRIAVMNNGVVEQIGTPQEIYKKPATSFVAGFMGTTNFLKGHILNNKSGDKQVLLIENTKRINISIKENGQRDVQIAVRPEDIYLGDPIEGELIGKITLVTYLGDYINYEIDLGGVRVIEVNEYSDKVDEIRGIGDKVSLTFPLDKINIYDADGVVYE